MKPTQFLRTVSLLAAFAVLTMVLSIRASAVKERVIHSFHVSDGAYPAAGLIFDSAGNLYGTTQLGGRFDGGLCMQGCGVVFELSPTPEGGVNYTVLYKFCSAANCTDGAFPSGGVVLDSSGNLYGMTSSGGGSRACGDGCGVVFELSPSPGSTWTEAVLHTFTGGDGGGPYAGLTIDSVGNLYGSADGGKAGLVFELTPSVNGTWNETVLYSFTGGADGRAPLWNLILDSQGNLYGTTLHGGSGSCGCGVVFELTPGPGGTWSETTLYTFRGGSDGASPVAGLILDSTGNLYGTTKYGGAGDGGTVFELMPRPPGWTEAVLYSFFEGAGGAFPGAGVTFDSVGNLYGTTQNFGAHDEGTVFELIPTQEGKWKKQSLSFSGQNGANPIGGVIFDSAGNLYGTTSGGGATGYGVVFRIAP